MMDSASTAKAPARRTQADRRASTRRRILDAALRTLLEKGIAGASTWAICETGGFSRGTLLHHFRQRTQLFEALVAEQSEASLKSLHETMASASRDEKLSLFLDWLWSTLDGDFFTIGLEILTAARTEADLLQAVRNGGDALAKLLDVYVDEIAASYPEDRRDSLMTALQGSIHMVRGIGLDLTIAGDRTKHQRTFSKWRNIIEEIAHSR